MKNRIFSVDNPKAAKAAGYGYLNAIHYMAPADVAGVGNLCPFASEGCKAACLGLYSGQAAIIAKGKRTNRVRQSRRHKARRFMWERKTYMRDVVRSIELLERKAQREGLKLCVRMNGSTDIIWEGIPVERSFVKGKSEEGGQSWETTKTFRNIFEAFPHVQFVDYTKIAKRMRSDLPPNYHLTFSRSETNARDTMDVLANGGNAAVVFAGHMPETFYGYRVVNGDAHDLRHLDARNVVVGLSPKGAKAKRDTSGFVVRSAREQWGDSTLTEDQAAEMLRQEQEERS